MPSVSESLRDYNGLSADLYKPSNYDKLALSLLSPLPNEQDFAINVCTLLSNEGKHTLRLDKYPRLVNILLAHAGVFDCLGTRQLFIEVYSKVRNYSINSFWSDVLDSQDVIDLTDERIFLKKPSPTLNTFSRRRNLKKEKANKNQESQEESSTPAEPVTVIFLFSNYRSNINFLNYWLTLLFYDFILFGYFFFKVVTLKDTFSIFKNLHTNLNVTSRNKKIVLKNWNHLLESNPKNFFKNSFKWFNN